MSEPGYYLRSAMLSKKRKSGIECYVARRAEGRPKDEHEIKKKAATCRIEIFLVFFWLKGRCELDGFGAASAFGLDCLVVGVTIT
jgi:hypothetical protein